MADHGETERLAAYLRMLKDRTGRSFDALSRRAGVSASSLHRYCAGSSVPTGFDSLHAFAKVCGATKEEVRELQRLWALADARRETPRAPAEQARPALDRNGADDPVSVLTGAVTDSAGATGSAHGDGVGKDPVTSKVPTTRDPANGEIASGPSIHIDAQDSAGSDDAGREVVAPRRRRTDTITLLATGTAVVLLAVAAWAVAASGRYRSDDGAALQDDRLLFSAPCRQVVSMGQNDECVRETQLLLKDAGGKLAVDGAFGPETLRRVTAFQVLAGLPPKGVVDDATKEALYARTVSMKTWPPAAVEKRIREVFVEAPDRAVAIADCQSYLDPLWVSPNTNGTRNWGVFQISDARLTEFKGTPLQAFDPEWNIQAAHQLWKLRPDFADWPGCARAARVSPMPTTPPAPVGASPGGRR